MRREDGSDLVHQGFADLFVGDGDIFNRSLPVPVGDFEGLELGPHLHELGNVIIEVADEKAVVTLGGTYGLLSRGYLQDAGPEGSDLVL